MGLRMRVDVPSTTDYVVVEHKGRLYPAVVAAARALRCSPVWEYRRDPTDPLPLCENLERLAEQVSFFSTEAVNTTLDALLAAGAALVSVITDIHTSSRPGFRGAVDARFHDDYQNALSTLDNTINDFATAARDDLGISGGWRPIMPAQ